MKFLKWLFDYKVALQQRKTFFLEVDATDDEPDRKPEKLRITHPPCGSGSLKTEIFDHAVILRCERCQVELSIAGNELGIGAIYATSTDGEERQVRGRFQQGFRRIGAPLLGIPEYSGIYVRKRSATAGA